MLGALTVIAIAGFLFLVIRNNNLFASTTQTGNVSSGGGGSSGFQDLGDINSGDQTDTPGQTDPTSNQGKNDAFGSRSDIEVDRSHDQNPQKAADEFESKYKADELAKEFHKQKNQGNLTIDP